MPTLNITGLVKRLVCSLTLVTAACIVGAPSLAFGQAPANDLPSAAELIPASGPFPHLTAITADITQASSEGDPVALPSCQENVSRSIWYQFTPATTTTYRFSTASSAPTATTVEDTVLVVYSAPAAEGPFTELACADDTIGTQSEITMRLTAGVKYWIAVYKWDVIPPAPGHTSVQVQVALSSTENTAPQATNDRLGVFQDTSVRIDPAKIIANDTDADGDTLTVASVSVATDSSGTVVLIDNMVVYTPRSGFSGDDGFSYTVSDGRGGMAMGRIEITVTPADAPSQNIVSMTLLPNQQMRIGFAGIPGRPYTIQVSTDLSTWQFLGLGTAGPNGLFFIDDVDFGNFPQRYYRTINPIVVEFADEGGASVVFVDPSQTGSAFTPRYSVPSGSIFPIGTEVVNGTANYAKGAPVSFTFRVTVLGAQGVTRNVLAELVDLQTQNSSNDQAKKIKEAIKPLSAALKPAHWHDETHLNPQTGDPVFRDWKSNVSKLSDLLNHLDDAALETTITDFITRLVRSGKLLATIAIREAQKNQREGANVKSDKIAKAEAELTKGNTDWENHKFSSALDHYRSAWLLALEHLR